MSTDRWRQTFGALALCLSVIAAVAVATPGRAGAVDVGQPAPEFKLASTFGTDIALSDFRGKKWVLLEFYGADYAPA
jgi:AhpC/TSA family